MTDDPDPGGESSQRRKWKRWLALLAVIVAALIVLLFLPPCDKQEPPPEAKTDPFDYFRAKADELGNDAQKALAFVREQVRTLPYRGDVKGALGALWDQAASPEEKLALAKAILAHCPDAPEVDLDAVAPQRDKAADPAEPTLYSMKIVHRLLLPGRDDGAQEVRDTTVYEGHIGRLVGNVHSVEALAEGRTRLLVRCGSDVSKEASTAGGVAEEIVFVLGGPGRRQPITVTRELWHKDNVVGPNRPTAGDRHDFVVLPCRISKYVREKEELLLKAGEREDAAEAKPYLGLLDYARGSDRVLEVVEGKYNVRAWYDVPRILILSRFNLPESALDGKGYAIDLRLNRPSFHGEPVDAYLATMVRSFTESGFEQHFLSQWSDRPSSSAYDVFCQLREDYPNHPARRLSVIRRCLAGLRNHGGLDGKLVLQARPPDGRDSPDAPTVTVTPCPDGAVRVAGGKVVPDFAEELAKRERMPKFANGTVDLRSTDTTEAALAVECALLGADVQPRVAPGYVLSARMHLPAPPLVAPGAVFRFAWGTGPTRTDQRIRILGCGDGLQLGFRVQTGTRPAVGTRAVTSAALARAAVHNPWYKTGQDHQTDATSFCVSRRVHAELKSGRSVDFALRGRHGPNDDPQAPGPIQWQGKLEPIGKADVQVTVNGQPETLAVLKCRLGDAEISILDDSAFSVGMAEKLVSVSTSIRGRLVDEKGTGMGGANVEIVDTDVSAYTWPDGSFRLPPPPTGSYGKVTVRATLGDLAVGEQELDLSAPGRVVHVLKMTRPRTQLVFLSPKQARQLPGLKISDQVKRHIRRELAAGRMVVVPNRMVDVGDGRTIGYYAFDNATGDIVAVTEDGLHGSSSEMRSAWRSALESLAGDLEDSEGKAMAPIHAYRGALVAWWVFSRYRLGGQSVDDCILALLNEMDAWEEATNMLTGIEKYAGGKVRGKLADKLNSAQSNVDGDGAKAAFKIGYLGSTLFLSTWPRDPGD